MNPRDQLAKEFLAAILTNPTYVTVPTPQLLAMAYEVTDAFLKQMDLSCPHCRAKPDAEGKVLHVSGCPGGWPE